MVKNGHFHISENSTYSVGRLRKKKSNPTFLNVRNVFSKPRQSTMSFQTKLLSEALRAEHVARAWGPETWRRDD